MTALSRTQNASDRRGREPEGVAHSDSADRAVPACASDRPLDVRMIMLRHAHHARASGYDRLADFIPATQIWPVTDWSIRRRAVTRLFRPWIRNSGLQWYHRDSLLAEIHAAGSWYRPGNRLYHFLYGENSFRYLGGLKRMGRRHSIVCTFHTPIKRFREVVRTRKHLDTIDGCIALTRETRAYFSELLGAERVFHIPHGVDTGHFYPAGTRRGYQPECLAVGSHMRDYEALREAAQILSARHPDVRFTIVAGKGVPPELESLDNTQVLRNVTDEALLQLYRRASLFLLPVREVTANNALLEAMACGLPVVATDLPGVRDHVSRECAYLVRSKDGEHMADSIETVLLDESMRETMGRAARVRALELDWTRIAARVRLLYDEISGR